MRAIFVQSADGVMARGSNDDMLWTPKIDKKIFQLISGMHGGFCIVGRNTQTNMPHTLKGRTYIPVHRNGYTLHDAAKEYPMATLCAGPTLLKAAYDSGLLHEIIVCTAVQINDLKPLNDRLLFNPFMYGEDRLPTPAMHVDFGEILVDIYRLSIPTNPESYVNEYKLTLRNKTFGLGCGDHE